MIIHDEETVLKVDAMRPYNYALDLHNPKSLSPFISLQPPIVAMIANWINEIE